MVEYYRYVNDERYNEDVVILLKALKPSDVYTPEWFEVVYVNQEEHKKFIGTKEKLFERYVRPVTNEELNLMN